MAEGGAAPTTPDPLIDESVLATIASLQRPGAPDLVARVLDLFEGDAPRRVADIGAGTAAFDAETVRTAAHTLKSSAANVGAMRLSARAGRIERAARDANLLACLALSDALEALLDETLDALGRRRAPTDTAADGAPDGVPGRRAA